MAEFNVVLTQKGKALLAKCIAGQELVFTKIALGDGVHDGSGEEVTELVSVCKTLPIFNVSQRGVLATVRASLPLNDVVDAFCWREIGVYAKDLESGLEILFAYANAGEKYDYISGAGASSLSEKIIGVAMNVQSTANVSAIIDDSLVYATQSDIDHLEQNKADKSISFSAVLLANGWSESAPYTQVVQNDGITQDANGFICVSANASKDEREAAAVAWLYVLEQTDGQMVVCADNLKPEIDVPITVVLLG
ncbi:MAG: phage tail protein [Oscillospiraceae bacterium]|nr:phage tail protein [Oscillospiraceae bacterium]